ncbi:MAG: DNA topoisomerase 3 [Planctomycetes bacterium]|nr:DNA topoisomerase 3 [Planctomycetota bacterium]
MARRKAGAPARPEGTPSPSAKKSAGGGSKALVITEKPSVARDIAGALGGFKRREGFFESDDRVITWAIGHLLELAEPQDLDPRYSRWRLSDLPILPAEFPLKPKGGSKAQLKLIGKLIARDDVGRIVNGCDAGREGELIFRELCRYFRAGKPILRLWLQSLTREAIRRAFESLRPGEEFEGLADAAVCRAESDWLIGMNATRALTRRLRTRIDRAPWSAGRVQTPTLAILVDRELAILAHRPVPYWRVKARFQAPDHEYEGTWFDPAFRSDGGPEARDDRIFDEARAEAIVEKVRGKPGVAGETRRASRETAPPLFDLTSLQREANRRFGFSARRTLRAAQRLYETHKATTYPRTDSRALPSDYRKEVRDVVDALRGTSTYGDYALRLIRDGFQNEGRIYDDSAVTDHFAIIPTGEGLDARFSRDDARIFDLIVRRFIAAFYPPAVWVRVERTTVAEGESFRSRSRSLDTPGWREVYERGEEEAKLPPLVPGANDADGVSVRTLAAEAEGDETRPPARITEATLLKLMENAGAEIDDDELAAVLHEKGLGTPATRAEIIENLISKGYVSRLGKLLRATAKGIRLIDVLRRVRIDRLASPQLTGELEFHLRQVEEGQRTRVQFMEEMVQYTREVVENAREFEFENLYRGDPPVGICPCPKKRPVVEGPFFYRCVQTEEDPCPFVIWKERSGRYMDRETVRRLLEERETPPLDGFVSRDGRPYSAKLAITSDLQVTLTPVRGEEAPPQDLERFEVNEEPLGRCPICKEGTIRETPTHYACDREGCSFTLPRKILGREMEREEVQPYVESGKTALLSGFISRKGRPFAAHLVLKPNGRHGYEFAQRAGASRGRGKASGGSRRPKARRSPAKPRKTAAAEGDEAEA